MVREAVAEVHPRETRLDLLELPRSDGVLGEEVMHLAARGRRHGHHRRHRRLAHGSLAVLQRRHHDGERGADAQLHLSALDLAVELAERALDDAKCLLANSPVFVAPRRGWLPDEIRGGDHAVRHERDEEVAPGVAHGGFEVAESVEDAGEEERNVRAEDVGGGGDGERRGVQRAGAHLEVVVLEEMRDGVGETRGVVAVRHLVALEVFLRGDGGDADAIRKGWGGMGGSGIVARVRAFETE